MKLPAISAPPVSIAPGPVMCGPPGLSAAGAPLPSSFCTVEFMCTPSSTLAAERELGEQRERDGAWDAEQHAHAGARAQGARFGGGLLDWLGVEQERERDRSGACERVASGPVSVRVPPSRARMVAVRAPPSAAKVVRYPSLPAVPRKRVSSASRLAWQSLCTCTCVVQIAIASSAP
ncbi:MAG TPA: hypothetical protein VFX59_30430 [Polyangiales bacterium]|nr:hypothetical protein [Polyangiales bacterium]